MARKALARSRALRPVARGANGSASIFLDGPVGFPKEGGMSAAQFREQLARAEGAPLLVHFNSEGGIVTEGIAMYNALRAYKGRKVGVVTGLAASIASVVLMACDEIRVAKGAYVMIHNPSGGAKGGADDLRAAATTLESMRSELLDIYEARTGIERKKLEKMLDAETYLTAEEAIECGMADALEDFEARITLQAVARLDPNKVPAELRAAAKGKKKAMKPKMKAKIKAAEEELAKLKAQASEEDPENSEEEDPEDSEEDPAEDSEEDPEDSEEDDDDKKESESAILSTVYALTKTKSAAVALGKLVGIVSKGTRAQVTNRAELVGAAIKAGIMPPSLKAVALKWPEKAFSAYITSMGGTKALKLGRVHTPPSRHSSEEETKPTGRETPEEKVARLTGVKVEDLKKVPPCAPQLKGGAS
jgi:ATP-dependent Clp protease protease subunit